MKVIKFDNIIDVHTGKTLQVEVPDSFNEDEYADTREHISNRGKEFAKRIKKVTEKKK